ncbi:MAG: ABC transporter ATP-binding protein [Bacteroidia bacterium]|nr:ABC transporter ATP-binding protein [Bacteroidia bacterium]
MAGIRIEQVSKSYKSVRALQDVSLNIMPGETLGLIGPDGAGKTTLIRIVATLVLADQGTVEVGRYDVRRDYRKIRNIMGYMPGKFSLYQDLSIIENLELFASVFEVRIEDNYDLIKSIYEQLAPFKDRRAGALSGGMKQKLALCCALVHRPQVLLLDEPTTGVDAVSRREFWETLAVLRQEGITILVSTPYMDEASRCDRVALIQEGRILRTDPPATIVADYPRPLFGVIGGKTYQMLQLLRQYPYAYHVFPFGDCIHVTDSRPEGTPAELQAWVAAQGIEGVQVTYIQANIEDSFMDLQSRTTL